MANLVQFPTSPLRNYHLALQTRSLYIPDCVGFGTFSPLEKLGVSGVEDDGTVVFQVVYCVEAVDVLPWRCDELSCMSNEESLSINTDVCLSLTGKTQYAFPCSSWQFCRTSDGFNLLRAFKSNAHFRKTVSQVS